MRLVHAGDRHIRQQEGGGTFADALAFQLPDSSQVLVEITELGDMIGKPCCYARPFHCNKYCLHVHVVYMQS